MKYLHTMIRVTDLDASVKFFCDVLGFTETRRYESEQGRFTLVFVAPDESPDCPVELTYNWDPEEYDEGRNFGHLAADGEKVFEARGGDDKHQPLVAGPHASEHGVVEIGLIVLVELVDQGAARR